MWHEGTCAITAKAAAAAAVPAVGTCGPGLVPN